MKISELEATGQPVCVGYGVLSRKPRTPCYGRFYLHKRPDAGRQGKGGCRKHSGNTAVARGSPAAVQ